jgi:hypothetical protein
MLIVLLLGKSLYYWKELLNLLKPPPDLHEQTNDKLPIGHLCSAIHWEISDNIFHFLRKLFQIAPFIWSRFQLLIFNVILLYTYLYTSLKQYFLN